MMDCHPIIRDWVATDSIRKRPQPLTGASSQRETISVLHSALGAEPKNSTCPHDLWAHCYLVVTALFCAKHLLV
jgi:hypothetical protein